MSLSGAVVTGILMIVIMYILLTMPGVVDNIIFFEETDKEASSFEETIKDTNISLSSLSTVVGTNIVTSDMYNTGSEKLWNFAKFDYIIHYNSTSNGRQLERLTYAGDCGGANPSSGKWCIDSFISDNIDPKIVNRSEGMTIKGATTLNINYGKLITTLSTERGVVTSISNTIS
jgi:archaeal flagellar protein FlaF